MSARTLLPIALVAAAAIVATPASAQTDIPAPGVQPGACTDQVAPTSSYTRNAARSALKGRALRGVASDEGCGLDRVAVAVNLKKGARCKSLVNKGRLGPAKSCTSVRWNVAKGSTQWSFQMPKHLPAGKYVVRTRAVDFSANKQRPLKRILRVR